MIKLIVLMVLLVGSLACAETQSYDLTVSDSLDWQISAEQLSLERNNELPAIQNFNINGCHSGPCPVGTGITHPVSVNTYDAVRCRMDIPELGWHQRWTGSGNRQFNTPVLEKDVTVTVACENRQSDTVSQTLAVYIDPEGCTPLLYPPGLTRRDGIYRHYNDDWEFGQSVNASFQADVALDEFLVLDSISLAENVRRRFVFVDAPTQRNINISSISISKCPGDFTDIAVCRFHVNSNSSLFFSTRPSDAGSFFCLMEPNTDYYINYIHAEDPYNDIPSCLSAEHSSCTFFGSETVMH